MTPPGTLRPRGLPLWEQIRTLVHDEIRSGRYQPGDRLPTEKEYADRFSVSVAPVRAALADLTSAGLIERRSGKGTFVTGRTVSYEVSLLRSTTDTLRTAGVEFTVDMVTAGFVKPDGEVARHLGLTGRERAFHLRRTVEIGGRIAVILETWLPRDVGDKLPGAEFFEDGGSLYRALAGHDIHLRTAEGTLQVVRADDEQSRLLGVDFGAPLLALRSSAADQHGRVVEVARATYDSNRFSMRLQIPATAATVDRPPAAASDQKGTS
ncbi:GntR family transcriptional regulator [Actinoplanes sp. LDG1-06]|uniref:GntR family transcriptional regulator n=1 Tax=Paractinoplanes ovalisporus TaxID=2810368 RepID=A0ABS2AII0_9ACTN|nr:GntR family transcriptional regulator [Actinoplanes ovalisporus]MBM2619647.1 GntR family transcriptional regulator [Actinoplanes ovalisporus]